MIKQKRGFRGFHQLGYFRGEFAVGNDNSVNRDRHEVSPVGSISPVADGPRDAAPALSALGDMQCHGRFTAACTKLRQVALSFDGLLGSWRAP
jgi:hypothetical protein